MITLRLAADRGHADRGWLNAWHSFSFAHYYDPEHMGFGPLRVLNDDRFAPGRGFGTHPHDNMEIVTYVLSGQLAHADSTGHSSVLTSGDIQRMSAGTGVEHSEFNASRSEWLHLLQIWIEPNIQNAPPQYGEARFEPEAKRGRLQALVSPEGRDGSLPIYQDAILYATLLEPGETVSCPLSPGRLVYVHVARGTVGVQGHRLAGGDAAMLQKETALTLNEGDNAEVLVFDLPA